MWNDKDANNINVRKTSESGGAEDNDINEEIKLSMYAYREEHSVEIRESKRKQILKKNRGVDSIGGGQQQMQGQGDFPDLAAIQLQTQEEYALFQKKYILYDRDDSPENQKDDNVKILISALTSNCSPQFFIFATSELHMYFQDEDLRTNITIQDIYRFIDIILSSNFLNKAKLILGDWQTAVGLTQQPQQGSYFYPMISQNLTLARSYLIGCLNIISGISRGGDNHCAYFQEYNFLQTFFDIFDATKTERDISEIMLFIIGNIAATRNSWRVFFMQRDFHNTIFGYLKFAPKNQENLILHRRICWCLSNFTRDYVSVQQNKGSTQILANGTVTTDATDNSSFDFSHIKNLCDTFIQYQDPEIRTDISWTFSQLITIFFNDTKNHPLLSGNLVKQNGTEVLNFNGNNQQMQIYKSLVTEKVGFLIQNGICEFINVVFPMADMTVLVPTLRIINRLMGGSAEVLELFFSKCNDVIMQNITRHLQNQVQAIRRETVKTVHYMFLSDLESAKEMWFNRFMQILLTRFNIELYSIKEEIYKLINSIIDKVNSNHFEIILFSQNNKYCIFKTMRNSLTNYETKPEIIITIISIGIKILNYYKLGNSNLENQKVKRIMQLLEQNNIPTQIERLQEHQQQGIYDYSSQFIEMYNNIQENIIDEEQRDVNFAQINQQAIQQDYLRLKPLQNRLESSDIEKNHEEQKI